MLTSAVIAVLLRQTKVNEEEFVAMTSNTHQEVVGFDVAMNEVFVVHILNSSNHLIC